MSYKSINPSNIGENEGAKDGYQDGTIDDEGVNDEYKDGATDGEVTKDACMEGMFALNLFVLV